MAPKPGWHIEDIKSAIRKTGLTCEGLSALGGYEASAVRVALRRPWPKVEALIARHLGLHPQDIWPDRFDSSGAHLKASGRLGTPLRRHPSSHATTFTHRKSGEAA